MYEIGKQTGEIFNKIKQSTASINENFNFKIDTQTGELIEVFNKGTNQVLYAVNESTNAILNTLDDVRNTHLVPLPLVILKLSMKR